MKVSELESPLLDYWVAICDEAWKTAHELYPAMTLDPTFKGVEIVGGVCTLIPSNRFRQDLKPYDPSVSWWIGGLIIERERIELCPTPGTLWRACTRSSAIWTYGQTPLIAAMRAFVASKFGEEVPDRSAEATPA